MLNNVLPGLLLVASLSNVLTPPERELTYSAAPLTMWLVDKQTGEGVPSVNVVAVWELDGGFANHLIGVFKVAETMSDEAGRVHFPGWGPETRRVRGAIQGGAPHLLFYKHGYRPSSITNFNSLTELAPPRLKSEWDGKKWALERSTLSGRDYALEVTSIMEVDIDAYTHFDPCFWSHLPTLWRYVQEENRYFETFKVEFQLFGSRAANPGREAQCADRTRQGGRP